MGSQGEGERPRLNREILHRDAEACIVVSDSAVRDDSMRSDLEVLGHAHQVGEQVGLHLLNARGHADMSAPADIPATETASASR
jgi:hypothetical protein